MKIINIFLVIFLLSSCSSFPETNNKVVKNFDIDKYMGRWYEIARLDHPFERGCDYAAADYSMRDDGKVKIVNSCLKDGKKDQAQGIAYQLKEGEGHFKVSFFRPFYGNYKIIYLDQDYKIALIDGGNTGYFWILARDKKVSKSKLAELLNIAKQAGFDTSKLIYPKQ